MSILKFFALFFAIGLSQNGFSQTFIPGNTYYDSTGYVEYRAGNIPIVLSAPHGGVLEPASIPDRDCPGCIYDKDAWTKPIAEGMYVSILKMMGCYPHLIINLLHRKKFDANRDIGEAADSNLVVEKAWRGYHRFIDSAAAKIVTDYKRGLFLDIHGHGHTVQRIELGYLLSAAELRLPDTSLNKKALTDESSVRTLVTDNIKGFNHAELLRGSYSFGSLLDQKGFPSVPSLSIPSSPLGDPYFDGGYNTQRHGSRDNDRGIDAIQIELNQTIRFDSATRERLIDSLATVTNQYLKLHFNDKYTYNICNTILSNSQFSKPNFSFLMYPNPAQDFINIKCEANVSEIAVYNYLGQKVLSRVWTGEKIDIRFLKEGYYLLQLIKDKEILVSKSFIKQ